MKNQIFKFFAENEETDFQFVQWKWKSVLQWNEKICSICSMKMKRSVQSVQWKWKDLFNLFKISMKNEKICSICSGKWKDLFNLFNENEKICSFCSMKMKRFVHFVQWIENLFFYFSYEILKELKFLFLFFLRLILQKFLKNSLFIFFWD